MIDARELIEDGVELRAVQMVLERWLLKHNLQPIEHKPRGHGWSAVYTDGRHFEDFDEEHYLFPTYHELLEYLLRRVDSEQIVDANMEVADAPQWKTINIEMGDFHLMGRIRGDTALYDGSGKLLT